MFSNNSVGFYKRFLPKEDLRVYLKRQKVSEVDIEKIIKIINETVKNRDKIYYYEIHNIFKQRPEEVEYNKLFSGDINKTFWKEFVIYEKDVDKTSKAEAGVFFIASTPRAGNTMLNKLLKDIMQIESYAVHKIDHLKYEDFEKDSIVQLHISSKNFLNAKPANIYSRVITIARHPFDVLISAFRFAQKEPQCSYWLNGKVFPEPIMYKNTNPSHKQFRKWAKSKKAKRALNVSVSWWEMADAKLKYEELLSNTKLTITKLLKDLDLDTISSEEHIEKVISEVTNNYLVGSENQHRWKGLAGNWKNYISPQLAQELYSYHKDVFDKLDYKVEATDYPDENSRIKNCLEDW